MIGIANGPAGLVVFYEQDVKDKVVELGLTTVDKIKRTSIVSSLALFVPQLTVIPAIVYLYNGVNGFWHGFLQLLGIYMIANLFDRFFIDEWWVGTCIGYPILTAIMSGLMQLLRLIIFQFYWLKG